MENLEYGPVIVLVKVKDEYHENTDLIVATSGSWKYDDEEGLETLRNADLVIAEEGKVIKGIFRNVGSQEVGNKKIDYTLQEVPDLAFLIGRETPDFLHWKPMNFEHWKQWPLDEFMSLLKSARG